MMHVYIMTNKPRGTLYIGCTSDLMTRAFAHRNHMIPGFTNRYNLTQLVYVEPHDAPALAIQHEKSLKRWRRDWKIALIEKTNPQWLDLWAGVCAAD